MKKWWDGRKKQTRRAKKKNEPYTFWDFIVDVLFRIPELLVLPFRMLLWLLRGIAKSILDIV